LLPPQRWCWARRPKPCPGGPGRGRRCCGGRLHAPRWPTSRRHSVRPKASRHKTAVSELTGGPSKSRFAAGRPRRCERPDFAGARWSRTAASRRRSQKEVSPSVGKLRRSSEDRIGSFAGTDRGTSGSTQSAADSRLTTIRSWVLGVDCQRMRQPWPAWAFAARCPATVPALCFECLRGSKEPA
jgi:hypothetical protein